MSVTIPVLRIPKIFIIYRIVICGEKGPNVRRKAKTVYGLSVICCQAMNKEITLGSVCVNRIISPEDLKQSEI